MCSNNVFQLLISFHILSHFDVFFVIFRIKAQVIRLDFCFIIDRSSLVVVVEM